MTSLSVHHRGSLVGSAAAGSGPISPGGGSNSEATTSSSNTSMAARDCQELKTLTLEWKLANLKQIFDSSQGQAKSKCIRSACVPSEMDGTSNGGNRACVHLLMHAASIHSSLCPVVLVPVMILLFHTGSPCRWQRSTRGASLCPAAPY